MLKFKKSKKIYLLITFLIIMMTILIIFGLKNQKDSVVLYPLDFETYGYDYFVTQNNITEQITKKYTNSQLKKMKSLNLSLSELNQKYPIECLKKTSILVSFEKQKDLYSVVYTSKNKILIMKFNKDGESQGRRIYDFSHSNEFYKKFKIDKTTWKEVHKFDRRAFYSRDLRLYTTMLVSDYSIHYTVDGYVIIYEYNDEGIVRDIKVELI